eukprot:1623651-Pleurochrysis_carterae.AAC.1
MLRKHEALQEGAAGSSTAGRFDLPGSSVSNVKGGEHDRLVDDEHDVYIVEQIDAARKRKGHCEYRMIWEGYPDPTWETAESLATAGKQVQTMVREAKNRAEDKQAGAT